MKATLLAVVCLLACTLPIPLFAAAQDAPDEVQGRAHFETGRAAFLDGHFEQALDEFKQAFELTARPELLYNIGQSADRLRHDQEALDAFEAYLARTPEATNRPEVEARIAILQQSLAAAHASEAAPASSAAASGDAVPEPAPVLPPPEAVSQRLQLPAPAPSNPLPWVLIGSSGALAVGGIVLLVVTLHDIGVVENAPKDTKLSAIRSAHDAVPVLSTLGFVFLGVGVAGAATGVIWKLTGDGASSDEWLTLRFGPGAAQISGRF